MGQASVTNGTETSTSGNTKTEVEKGDAKNKKNICNSSKRFAFTLNNYTESEYTKLKRLFESECAIKWIMGKETGESGTSHIQGYIELDDRIRPKRYFGNNRIHWEIAKGCRALNVEYCTKEGIYEGNLAPIPIIDTLKLENFYSWQKQIYDKCKTIPDHRTISWICDYEGNGGKTTFCKYMVVHHNYLILEGKSTDMFHGIASYYKTNGYFPKVIFIDVPRESLNYINYAAIEKIKNGLLFSGKYEGKQLVFNCPHIFIFANELPKLSAFSIDRWDIGIMNEQKELDTLDWTEYDY